MLTFQFESESESETTFTIPGESESEYHLNPFAKCNIPVESESVESESVGTSCKLHLNLNQLNQNQLNQNPLSFIVFVTSAKCMKPMIVLTSHIIIMKVLQKRVVTTCISLFRFMNTVVGLL